MQRARIQNLPSARCCRPVSNASRWLLANSLGHMEIWFSKYVPASRCAVLERKRLRGFLNLVLGFCVLWPRIPEVVHTDGTARVRLDLLQVAFRWRRRFRRGGFVQANTGGRGRNQEQGAANRGEESERTFMGPRVRWFDCHDALCASGLKPQRPREHASRHWT